MPNPKPRRFLFRKVVKTERQLVDVGHGQLGGTLWDTLECGHITFNKLSAGYAKKRHCIDCHNLKYHGGTVTDEDHIETWDHKKDELVRTPITKEPANEAG